MSEKGPGSAARSGSERGRAWGRAIWSSTATLLHSGLTPRLALQALLLTLLTYGIANTWLLWRVERAYRTTTFDWLVSAPADDRLEIVCEQARAKRSLKAHTLIQAVFQGDAPASQQFAQLIEGIASDPATAAERRSRIHTWITGDIDGVRFLVMGAQPISGEELISRIERHDAAWKHKLDGQKDQASDLREFLVGFADLVIQELRPSVRSLQRINGWIQWATIYVTWMVLLATAHRALLLAWLNDKGWFAPRVSGDSSRSIVERLAGVAWHWTGRAAKLGNGPTTDAPKSADEGARGEIPPLYDGAAQAAEFLENRHLPDLLDRQVYGPLSFLLGLLPSLGFIGTVQGMGDALLRADGLFQAQDKGAAISRITTHLGFAFDTTLVALLAGIVASAIVVRLRVWENQLWHLAEQTKKA